MEKNSSNRQIALAAILKDLGVDLNTSSMSSRIEMQKAIYLAQVSGADLGYRFSWYVRGPYSSALSDDYFEAQQNARLQDFSVSKELESRLRSAKRVIQEKPKNVQMADWLEVVASLDYLKRVRGIATNRLRSELLRLKPKLSHLYTEASRAIQHLK